MRGRVPQRAKRIQRLNGVLRLVGRVDALGFVNDHNRSRCLYELNRLVAGELVALLVDHIALPRFRKVLYESLDIDDQDLQRVATGELSQPTHLLRVVYKALE